MAIFTEGSEGSNSLNVELVYTLVTDTNGQASAIFDSAFITTPNVQATIINGSPKDEVKVAISTTDVQIQTLTYDAVNLLGVEVLKSTPVAAANRTVDLLINGDMNA